VKWWSIGQKIPQLTDALESRLDALHVLLIGSIVAHLDRPRHQPRPERLVHRHRLHRHRDTVRPSRVGAASVHFASGARTAWHSHPFGQTIYVTEGVGLCHGRGAPVEVIRPGERVVFERGEDRLGNTLAEPGRGVNSVTSVPSRAGRGCPPALRILAAGAGTLRCSE
jgi:quercetin dioxygenase-like cupin family protein